MSGSDGGRVAALAAGWLLAIPLWTAVYHLETGILSPAATPLLVAFVQGVTTVAAAFVVSEGLDESLSGYLEDYLHEPMAIPASALDSGLN